MAAEFARDFQALTCFTPLSWQQRLFLEYFARGLIPGAVDVPTGLGKTSVMALWLIARAHGARLPRRLVYVVDRRAVVDQATDEAEKLRRALEGKARHLKPALGIEGKLPISTLRGAHVDNRDWLADPVGAAIVVGTVDMVGSRLLFSGYGVSPKMRPYQAGLLGVDTLVVLDESHLVPPFAHLLHATEGDAALWPKAAPDRGLLPAFVVLPLSATQRRRTSAGIRQSFRLIDEDMADTTVAKRLGARKRLRLEALDRDADRQLARAAWALRASGGEPRRIVVFCDRRDKQDGAGGPSAAGVKEELESLRAREKVDIHPVELLVGARRVHERQGVEERLRAMGFIGDAPRAKPAFLVATSAGEVGIDIDADHMVADLVSWERMVQRLGRVNRRGAGDAEVVVFHGPEPAPKSVAAPTEAELRAATAFAAKAVIEHLPRHEDVFDASPGALRALAKRGQEDESLGRRIEAATTPEPLRPALTRALADAWSMTSLDQHAGRPAVAPWLRGWVAEEPQTTVVWRTYLPVRLGEAGRVRPARTMEINDFFAAAPPLESEGLETETHRVVSWLQARNAAIANKPRRPAVKAAAMEDASGDAGGAGERWGEDDVVAILLSPSNEFEKTYALGELAAPEMRDALREALAGNTLVVDARLGGLEDGLLKTKADAAPEAADTSQEDWSEPPQFRVRQAEADLDDTAWHFAGEFVLRRDPEGLAEERLVVEHFGAAAETEDARSVTSPQTLAAHQELTRLTTRRMAEALGLPPLAIEALEVAAALHDEGKRAPRWQQAFNAGRAARTLGMPGPFAKTAGPIDQGVLDHYRHEFGSLPAIERDGSFKGLPEEWRDLVLHLVAAHHGSGRPLIETRGADGPPSQLEARAREVALRYARLQRRWGPWGLAWWEALLRGADQQASRETGGGA